MRGSVEHVRWRQVVGDSGAAAVEFALVSLVLLPLLFGLIAFGFGMFRTQAASHAAREGARLAAVGVDNCGSFVSTVKARGTGAQYRTPAVEMRYSGTPVVGGEVVVDVNYTVSLALVAWLPGIPAALDLSQQGRSRAERVGTQTSCSG